MLWISLCASRSISSCGISASFKDTHTHTPRVSAQPRAALRGRGMGTGVPRGRGVPRGAFGSSEEKIRPRLRRLPERTRGAAPRLSRAPRRGWAPGCRARCPPEPRHFSPSPPAPAGSPPAEPPAEVCPNGLKVRGGPGSTGAGRATAAPGPGKVGVAPQRRAARSPRPTAPVAKPGTRPHRSAPPGPHPPVCVQLGVRTQPVPAPRSCRSRSAAGAAGAARCAVRRGGGRCRAAPLPLCLQITAARLYPGGVNLFIIYPINMWVRIYIYIIFFQAQPTAPERNARSFPVPMARTKWQLAFLPRGAGRVPPAGPRRGDARGSQVGTAAALPRPEPRLRRPRGTENAAKLSHLPRRR